MDVEKLHRVCKPRISARQTDELIGIARGLLADWTLNQAEVEFLQKWLVANKGITEEPLLRLLYARVEEILADGVADETELHDLMDTLKSFVGEEIELGETIRSTKLPLCTPAPKLTFAGKHYCFTGTFTYGTRSHCENAVIGRGGSAGSLTRKTNVLVIGSYATESWKHSSYGLKIQTACEWRDDGHPISIVSEEHWLSHL